MLGVREELLHPMIAHFPLAMFSLSLVTKLLELSFKSHRAELAIITKFLLYTAPAFFLLTMFLGDFALDIIKPNFCELSKVYAHEDHAYYALYFFIGAIASQVGVTALKGKEKIFQALIVIFLIGGNFFMFKSAHSGGELVYEYGAAVKNHHGSCQ